MLITVLLASNVAASEASSTTAAQSSIETSEPVWEAVRRIQGRTGLPISLEDAPQYYRRIPIDRPSGRKTWSPLPTTSIDLNLPTNADEAPQVLEEWVNVHNARLAEQGRCERFAVTTTSYGLHVAPSRAVLDGTCTDYISLLDQPWSGAVVVQSGGGLKDGFETAGLDFVGWWPGKVQATAADSLRSILHKVLIDSPTKTFRFVYARPRGVEDAWVLQLLEVGQTVLDLDPAEYPHHAEHAHRAYRESRTPDEIRRRDRLLDQRQQAIDAARASIEAHHQQRRSETEGD